MTKDEKLMQRALDMMERTHFIIADNTKHAEVMEHLDIIEALRDRILGGLAAQVIEKALKEKYAQ